MRLLLAFIAVPLIEIGLFIQVGGIIGLWPTLLVVLLTAIAGTWLVRSQGTQTLQNLQGSLKNMKDPTEPLAHGAMILLAGALLLTPGFFTDAIGFLLLFPPFRVFVMRKIKLQLNASNFNFAPTHPDSDDDVIEGKFQQVSPKEGPSGWTKD
jgi:UPF0716 protein FxsA